MTLACVVYPMLTRPSCQLLPKSGVVAGSIAVVRAKVNDPAEGSIVAVAIIWIIRVRPSLALSAAFSVFKE